MSRLTLDRLGKRYGDAVAVDDVTLDVTQGELLVLLGPSGCGKTTTLRMVAGFVAASSGDVRLDGRSILALPPHRRGMGLVFQSYALFPHLSVARNVAFGLEMAGMARAQREARVAEMLALARLETLADRLPRQLSGGQQQRVALARALAIHPRVLLLDEPLSNLDAALRGDVGRDIRLLQREMCLTTVMVTHDQDEAMAMADRLVVMRAGRVEQVGTQADLYERPASPFVAGFIGRSTLVEGTLEGSALRADGVALRLAGRYGGPGGAASATLALRPERLRLHRAGEAGPGGMPDRDPPGAAGDAPGSLPGRASAGTAGSAPGGGRGGAEGTVELASYLGAVQEHTVRLSPGLRLVVREPTAAGAALHAPGTQVTVSWPPEAERLFDAAGVPLPPLRPALFPGRSAAPPGRAASAANPSLAAAAQPALAAVEPVAAPNHAAASTVQPAAAPGHHAMAADQAVEVPARPPAELDAPHAARPAAAPAQPEPQPRPHPVTRITSHA